MRARQIPYLWMMVVGIAQAQQAPLGAVNRITGIRLATDGSVEVSCQRQPNFTTLNLEAPARLVVDFADTVLSDPPHETAVHHQGLAKVTTASFSSDNGAMSRVIFTLEPDSDADIEPMDGNRIRVRFTRRRAAAPMVAAAGAPPASHSLDSDVDDLKAKEEALAQARAAAEEVQRIKDRAASEARAKSEAEAKAKAASEAALAAEARANAAREAKAKAESESQLAAEAKAQAEAKAKAAADDEARAEQNALALQRAEAAAEAQAAADRVARAQAEAKAKAVEERLAQVEAQRKQEADARQSAEAQARADAQARARAEGDAKAAEDARTKAEADRAAQAVASREDQRRADASEQRAEAAEARAATESAQAAEAARASAARESALKEQALQAQAQARGAAPAQPDPAPKAAHESPATKVASAIDTAGAPAAPSAPDQRSAKAAEARAQAEMAERDRRRQLELQQAERAEAEARAEAKLEQSQRDAERSAQVIPGAEAPRVAPKPPARAASGATAFKPPEEARTPKQVRVASIGGPEHVASRTGMREITLVGFKETATGGRAFIKASEAPRFTVSEIDATTLMVELTDARIGQRNNALPLDTSFFPGAVALISPAEDRRTHTVRVEIKLKQPAPYTARVEGTDLVIDFPNTPTP